MELQRPLAVVTSGVDGDVLRVLGSTHAEFSVPRLHELIPDRSIPGIRRSVERLTTQGIVERLSIGRVAAYRLNDDHLAAPAVRELADLKSAFLERLRRHVGAWPHPPVFGALFGSAARGEMRPDSDLDIILVRPDDAEDDVWARGLADLTRAASTWTGNDARIIDFATEEITDAATEPLLRSVLADGIAFTDDADWLRRTLRKKGSR
ncbi:nucleotidyltransferase family protein [Microbacterium kyungheense]|uniref:Nucleotidyltransferase-like protein n=1 Tax=Microbacterium kyungheense TaxID=1263636 RepID=A0A543FK50_9MICO|nr:nucleotidyltransferase domain-containing protein [Microbacterium kyungheense]TQM34084.1 nucleotidyltransferase-like protein [Microbacterium kyungheense]